MAWEIGAFEVAATATPPTVEAGGPYSGTVSTAISLDSTVTPGTDGSPTLAWTIDSGGTGTFSSTTIADPTFTPDAEATYTLRLTVSPDDGDPVFDTASLTSSAVVAPSGWEIGAFEVSGTITPPTVEAGGPYSGTVGAAISLSGASVTEGTGTATLAWSITGGGAGTFSSTTIQNPTFTPSGTGVYTLQLSADPDDGAAVTDSATLTSNANATTGWEIGAWETPASAPSTITLNAELGGYTMLGRQVDLEITGDVTVIPVTLQAAAGTYMVTGYPAILDKGTLTLSAELGEFVLTGFDADASYSAIIRPLYTWNITAGSGTSVSCSVAGFSGTVDAGDWTTTPNNNKRWPISEGTGATLNEQLTGDDSFDATIQNYTDEWFE